MNEKKPQKMTHKMFLHRASGKVSAAAFIQANRDFLTTGELASRTEPILAKLDAKEILPTLALGELNQTIFNHMLEVGNQLEEEKQKERAAKGEKLPGGNKAYRASILNAEGKIQTRVNAKGEVEQLTQTFDFAQRAAEWCDRRLVEGAPDWHGLVEHPPTHLAQEIPREDSFKRIFLKAKTPFMKRMGAKNANLSNQAKVRNDHANFSRG